MSGAASPHASSHVIVVGGGLAGVAAALRLSEQGVRVTLLETRKKLGGRATSFTDVRSGQVLDNCQHVVLGCCTNYLDLLDRLAVRDKLRWTREQYWIEAGGRTSVIRPAAFPPLPAPLHFAFSFLRASFLSIPEAAAIAGACLRMLSVDRRSQDHRTFRHWLQQHRQSDRAIARFWSPVVVSACNLDCDAVSAASAIHVFQEGFLANAHAADVGVAATPLVELYDNVPGLIESRRGTVLLGVGVEEITPRSVRTTRHQTLHADAVICAVPVERVNRLVSDQIRRIDPRFAPLDRFTHSPILGVHLRFDRNVMGHLPHAVFVERGTQWLFRKNDEGSYVHAVISAADAWIELSEDQIAQRVWQDIRECLPSARDARLLSARAVKEKLATFAPTPGLAPLRPAPLGPSGVFLAGDYTDTAWPATMEGATRSGYAAAAAVLQLPASDWLIPGLPAARVASALGLNQ